MDTKSKKSKSIIVWIFFFIGLNLVVALSLLGINAVCNQSSPKEISNILTEQDVKETAGFQQNVSNYFNQVAAAMEYSVREQQARENSTVYSVELQADVAEDITEEVTSINEAVSDNSYVGDNYSEVTVIEAPDAIWGTSTMVIENGQWHFDWPVNGDGIAYTKDLLSREGSNLLYFGSNGNEEMTNTSQQLIDEQGRLQQIEGYDYYIVDRKSVV